MKAGNVKIIDKISPKYYHIISFFVSSLTMYLILSYAGVLSTGKYCLMVGDLFDNYAPAIRELCRDILSGQSIYYSWTHSLGMNTALYNAYYAYSPLNIIFLLLYNVDINKVIAAIIIIKTGLSALFFQLYSKKALKVDGSGTILFSVCYSLCAFQVSYNVVNIIWLDALYVLPLVLLSIHVLIESNIKIFLILSFAYIFISNFYMGYILGLFSFIYILSLLIVYKYAPIVKIIINYFVSAIISILISSIVWMPALLFLINNNPDDATNYYVMNYNILDVIFQLFLGQNNGFDSTSPNIYCGILCLLLLPVFFINKHIEIKKKLFYGILLSFLFVSCVIKPLYSLWHAFDAPDGWYNRFSFLISFVVCAMCVLAFDSIGKISKKVITYCGFIEIFFYVVFCIIKSKTVSINYMFVYIIINAVMIVLWIMLLIFNKQKIQEKSIIALFLLVICLEQIINGYSSFYRDSRFIPSTPEYVYYGWEKSMKYVQSELAQKDGFYRVNYFGNVIDNSDSFFGYNGMADFGSAENPNVRKALSKMGLYTSPRVLEPYGSTKISNMLFGVKYEIEGIVPAYVEIADYHPLITEVDTSLNLAYMVDEEILEFEFGSNNAFVNNNDLLGAMVGYKVTPFKEIDKSNIKIISKGIDFTKLEDRYLINGKKGEEAALDFVLDDANFGYIYFYNGKSILDNNSFLLNYGKENLYNDSGVISVSYIKPFEVIDGEQVVEIIQGEYEEQYINDYYIYYFDDKVFDDIYNILSENNVSVEEIDDGYVKCMANVKEGYSTMMTTIPYDPGWTAEVDGRVTEIKPIVDGAFVCIPYLNEGEHVVEFKYKAKGVRTGFAVSIVGIIACVICLFLDIKKDNVKGCSVDE